MENGQLNDVEVLARECRELENELKKHISGSNQKMKDLHNDVDEEKTDPNYGLIANEEEFTGSLLGTISSIANDLKTKKEEMLEKISSMEDVAKIGDIVEIEILDGEEFTILSKKLVPTFKESTDYENCVSIISPVGSAIYGQPVGTKVALDNNRIVLLSGIIRKDSLTEEQRIIRIKNN